MLRAHSKDLILSCHDISLGGLGVALAEMCIAGDKGIEISLQSEIRADKLLFSESNTRWVVEVDKKDRKEFEDNFTVPITHICDATEEISDENRFKISIDGEEKIDLELDELRETWKNTLGKKMGD